MSVHTNEKRGFLVAWKSQRTRTLDLVLTQAETAHEQVQAMRDEMTRLNRDLALLHGELAKRDVELIDALARTTALTDQLRIQNDQDRAHHDRLDRAIELLTMVIASSAAPALLLEATSGSDVSDPAPEEPAAPTVIGGSIDPSRIADDPALFDSTIDLTIDPSDELDPPGAAGAPDRLRQSDATAVWTNRG